MPDPIQDRDHLSALLSQVVDAARGYLARVDELPAGGSARRDEATGHFVGELPEDGNGSLATLTSLLTHGVEAATNSAGPKYFHFVTGGSTPAALAADWLGSALDNNAGVWISAPLGSKLEQGAIGWLKDLFRLATGWGGGLGTGAPLSNFTAPAAARQWWGQGEGGSRAGRRV